MQNQIKAIKEQALHAIHGSGCGERIEQAATLLIGRTSLQIQKRVRLREGQVVRRRNAWS